MFDNCITLDTIGMAGRSGQILLNTRDVQVRGSKRRRCRQTTRLIAFGQCGEWNSMEGEKNPITLSCVNAFT